MEQPKHITVRELLKATWQKALIFLISIFVLLEILVFITNVTAYFSVQMNPYVIAILSASVYLLSMLVPILILAYILYVLIKAK